MDEQWIYHEVQDSSLCGQHALNTLLQGNYFTAVDLADIAADIDQKVRELMLSMGTDTTDALKFMAEDSGNVNESGFFSIEVLRTAIERFGDLKLLSAASEEVAQKSDDLTSEKAFICNRQEHWFTIRKIAGVWFNLNSTEKQPEVIRPFYLSAFLAQLQSDGYSVFVVRGSDLPERGFHDDADGMSDGVGRWYKVSNFNQPSPSKAQQQQQQQGGQAASSSSSANDYWSRLGGGSILGGGSGGQTLGGGGGGEGGGSSFSAAVSAAATTEEDEDLARAIAMSMADR